VAHPAATINVAPVARQHDQTHDGPTGYDRKETTQHGCQVTPRSHHTRRTGLAALYRHRPDLQAASRNYDNA
jgi:hypothetical protein